jgi:hypothetical protein
MAPPMAAARACAGYLAANRYGQHRSIRLGGEHREKRSGSFGA